MHMLDAPIPHLLNLPLLLEFGKVGVRGSPAAWDQTLDVGDWQGVVEKQEGLDFEGDLGWGVVPGH